MGSSLLIALSMYSILPVPRVEWKEDNMRWSLACLPVVGLLGGGLLAGWAVLTWTFPVSPIFFGAVAALLPIILSGGFHMDGFLDATDAIFSRRDRDRKLEIMKDPHCGPFAVLSCAALLCLWHKRMVLKQFGGLTGDLLGYLIQILELTVLLILAFGSIWVR